MDSFDTQFTPLSLSCESAGLKNHEKSQVNFVELINELFFLVCGDVFQFAVDHADNIYANNFDASGYAFRFTLNKITVAELQWSLTNML